MHELDPELYLAFLEAQKQEARKVELVGKKQNELVRGFLPFHIDPWTEYSLQSKYRGVCDVAILLMHHKDGSLDGALSHVIPNAQYRMSHASFFDELPSPGPFDQPFSLLLATQPEEWLSLPESFILLYSALVRKTGGRGPEVRVLDRNALRESPDTDLYYQRRRERGRMVDTVRVNNPFYVNTIVR